jgi:hypothetical protein
MLSVMSFFSRLLDRRVAAREEESLVAVVRPADHVRRASVIGVNLEDLAVSVRLAHMVALHDQPVAR